MASAGKEENKETNQVENEENTEEKPAKDSYQMDAVKQVDEQVQETTELMKDNIKAVAERGENLEDLQEKAENIEEGTLEFKKSSEKVKRKYCCKSMRMTLLTVAIIVAIIVIIVVVVVLVVLKPWESGKPEPEPETTTIQPFIEAATGST